MVGGDGLEVGGCGGKGELLAIICHAEPPVSNAKSNIIMRKSYKKLFLSQLQCRGRIFYLF